VYRLQMNIKLSTVTRHTWAMLSVACFVLPGGPGTRGAAATALSPSSPAFTRPATCRPSWPWPPTCRSWF